MGYVGRLSGTVTERCLLYTCDWISYFKQSRFISVTVSYPLFSSWIFSPSVLWGRAQFSVWAPVSAEVHRNLIVFLFLCFCWKDSTIHWRTHTEQTSEDSVATFGKRITSSDLHFAATRIFLVTWRCMLSLRCARFDQICVVCTIWCMCRPVLKHWNEMRNIRKWAGIGFSQTETLISRGILI